MEEWSNEVSARWAMESNKMSLAMVVVENVTSSVGDGEARQHRFRLMMEEEEPWSIIGFRWG